MCTYSLFFILYSLLQDHQYGELLKQYKLIKAYYKMNHLKPHSAIVGLHSKISQLKAVGHSTSFTTVYHIKYASPETSPRPHIPLPEPEARNSTKPSHESGLGGGQQESRRGLSGLCIYILCMHNKYMAKLFKMLLVKVLIYSYILSICTYYILNIFPSNVIRSLGLGQITLFGSCFTVISHFLLI